MFSLLIVILMVTSVCDEYLRVSWLIDDVFMCGLWNTNCYWRQRFRGLLRCHLELATYRSASLVTVCGDVCQTPESLLVSSSELAHLRTIHFALCKCTHYYYIIISVLGLGLACVVTHDPADSSTRCLNITATVNVVISRKRSHIVCYYQWLMYTF